MSIRVYALAKELKVDNKSLMDLCGSIGIVTKGKSALASISDEDAVKVKEHVLHGKSASSRGVRPAEPKAPLEPPKSIVTGRVPTLPSKPRRTEKNDSVKVESGLEVADAGEAGAARETGSVSRVDSVDASKAGVSVDSGNVAEGGADAKNAACAPEVVSKKSGSAGTASISADSASEKTSSKLEEGKSSNRPTDSSVSESGKEEVLTKSVQGEEKKPLLKKTSMSGAQPESSAAGASVSAAVVAGAEVAGTSEKKEKETDSGMVSAVMSVAKEAVDEGSAKSPEKDSEKSESKERLSDAGAAGKSARKESEPVEGAGSAKPDEPGRREGNLRRGRDGAGRDGGRDSARDAKDAGRDAGKDAGRGERRRGGNGPLSRKMRKDAPAEESSRSHGMSVAEKIARQAQMEAPIRPVFDNSFPTLQNARTIRHEEPGKTAPHRDDRRAGGLRLAPLPAAKAPVTKKEEPTGMKPEVRLTPDEIRAARAGDNSIMRRMEQELEKNRTKEPVRDNRNRNKERGPRDRGTGTGTGAGTGTGDRTTDKKVRRGAPNDKTPRQPVTPVPAEDAASRFGTKKVGGKLRKDASKRPVGVGEGPEALHAPGRDARFGANDKRGKSRRINIDDDDDGSQRIRWRKQKASSSAPATAPRKSSYVLQLPLTVRSFAESVGLTAAKVLGKLLMEFGMPLTITSPLDETTAQLLADSFGLPVDIRQEVTLEERLIGEVDEESDDENDLVSRPPVVTFLGHVDHGKTSLLDRIININVVSGEKGGITQHIRAYNVKYQNKSVTFVDTPGHEAFTEMRARGANTTDIAVIVVAADDGVMPQTEEAISHARAAGVPIIVALNKIDLPGVNELRILQELAANELTPSEWGGDVEVVRCSALTGQGIDELMETILMVAELQEFRANPKRAAKGVCIESSIQQGRGVIAKLLVQNGTLHTGDVVVCGSTFGRVKAMVDTLDAHKKFQTAGPAIPVSVLGLDNAPGAGDKFYVLDDIADARRLAEERAEQEHISQLAGTTKSHVTLEGLFDTLGSKEVKTLNIILRTDVRGSIEAIKKELGKLEHEEVQIGILQASVGGITEADVQLADASDAIIIGFNVVPDENARVLAEQKGVQVRRYDIIYQLTADVKAALEGMLAPEEHEKELGRAVVQQTFQITKVGTVAGCRVMSGTIVRDCKIRIIRNNRVIGTYALDTLKREKDDVKEVRDGYECGMRLAGFNDVKDGDIFEAFQIESIARTF